jgi:hypothetical protein
MTLYFYGTVSGEETLWEDTGTGYGNWFTDHSSLGGAHTDVAATALPGSTDDVVFLSSIEGPGVEMTVNTAVCFSSGAFNGLDALICTGGATFNGASNCGGYITGDVTFNGTSFNNGVITGNVTLNDSSHNSGTVSGNATFNDSSYSDGGTVNGTITHGDGWNAYDAVYWLDNTATTLSETGGGVYLGHAYQAGEVVTITGTTVYVKTTGNDATGEGTELSPFLTAQFGYHALLGSTTGDVVLDFGASSVGMTNFGGITLTADWPVRISVHGAGATTSIVGGVSGSGADSFYDYPNSTEVASTAGFNIEIVSDNTVNLGDIYADGGSALDNGTGGNSGSVSLTSCKVGSILARGGRSDIASDCGSGGSVDIYDTTAGTIFTYGGDSNDAPGLGGAGGGVVATNSVCTNIIANGGMGGDGASAGNVTLTNSTSTAITADGGIGIVGPSGHGGNVTLTNSVSSSISMVGGSCIGPDLGGNGGNASLTSSTSGAIFTSGGNGTGYNGGISGNVTMISSTSGSISSVGGAGDANAGGWGGTVSLTSSATGVISTLGGYGFYVGAIGTTTIHGHHRFLKNSTIFQNTSLVIGSDWIAPDILGAGLL